MPVPVTTDSRARSLQCWQFSSERQRRSRTDRDQLRRKRALHPQRSYGREYFGVAIALAGRKIPAKLAGLLPPGGAAGPRYPERAMRTINR
jgi:hypothetical protein